MVESGTASQADAPKRLCKPLRMKVGQGELGTQLEAVALILVMALLYTIWDAPGQIFISSGRWL